jgi:hypothetical protein
LSNTGARYIIRRNMKKTLVPPDEPLGHAEAAQAGAVGLAERGERGLAGKKQGTF